MLDESAISVCHEIVKFWLKMRLFFVKFYDFKHRNAMSAYILVQLVLMCLV